MYGLDRHVGAQLTNLDFHCPHFCFDQFINGSPDILEQGFFVRENFPLNHSGHPRIPWPRRRGFIHRSGGGTLRKNWFAMPYAEFVTHRFTKSLSPRRIDSMWERCRWFCATILFNVRITISARRMISSASTASNVGISPGSRAQPNWRRAVSTARAALRDLLIPIPHQTSSFDG
jgi:hypothetical protein